MPDLLLELRSEEIPARMQRKAAGDLKKLVTDALVEAGLTYEGAREYWTPRRLTLDIRGLNARSADVREEKKGPRTDANEKAIEGFLRGAGLSSVSEAQVVSDPKKGDFYIAIITKPGRPAEEIIASVMPGIIRGFAWPKSMRSGPASMPKGSSYGGIEGKGSESLRWVRPLQSIVALLGEEIVPFAIEGIHADRIIAGHRFHFEGQIAIQAPASYAEQLRSAHVIVDQDERRRLIEQRANALATEAGLELIPDAGLVAENAGLTEWPVPLLGRFDPAFLEVPPEVIQLTLRINQKYFVLRDGRGALANAFICTANIDAIDGGKAIVAGNGKVLTARLSDARFFWEQDKKTRLEDHAKKLARITFHEKLGTVADKVERVAKLARWLAEEGVVKGADPDQAEQAARLAKADLVTEMVGEFPELQGLMGGYYARAEGLPDAVADAIRDHYKPVGQGDEIPTAPLTIAVSLADKLDTLVGFFQIGEKPTGSKDPFALRRASLGILGLIIENGIRVSMRDLLTAAMHPGGGNAGRSLADFLIERLKVQQREAGIRHDMIDAVVAVELGGDNVRMVNRVRALQNFITTDDGINLLAGYKRAANILKKERPDTIKLESEAGEEDPGAALTAPDVAEAMRVHEHVPLSYAPEPAEAALIAALDQAEPRADAAIAVEDFEGAMAALATLRAPIDAFFDGVTVNDSDEVKRESRLNLLTRIRAAVHKVADFSAIEG